MYNRLNKDYIITGSGRSKSLIKKNYFTLDLTRSTEINVFSEQSKKCDVLIFLVGLAHKKGKKRDLDEFRNVNKNTLINLIESLKKYNNLPPKIIFASTISVYGEKMNKNIYNEDSNKKPFSPYAITKLEAEDYLLDNFKEQTWILRFAPVYAPNFQLNINRRTMVRGFFYRIGNGSSKLSLCNMENIISVIHNIIEDKVPNGIYNISDKKDYDYNDLLRHAQKKWVIQVPNLLIKWLYYFGNMMNNIFIKENSTKLISDNVFPSKKIRKYIKLPFTLDDLSQEKKR